MLVASCSTNQKMQLWWQCAAVCVQACMYMVLHNSKCPSNLLVVASDQKTKAPKYTSCHHTNQWTQNTLPTITQINGHRCCPGSPRHERIHLYPLPTSKTKKIGLIMRICRPDKFWKRFNYERSIQITKNMYLKYDNVST
jgi:hypothetical protein